MANAEHHFVPAFLLREWETGKDDKLTSFRWCRGKVVPSRFKAKSVAKRRHLYSTGVAEGRPLNLVETEFMAPVVDGPAAVVHQELLAGHLQKLSPQHRTDWARFLVSQMVRVPAMVAHIRARGREILIRGDEPVAADMLNPGERQVSLSEWLAANMPGLFDDLGIDTLPHIITSQVLNGVFLDATWGVHVIKHTLFDFVISDQPLIYKGQMKANFLFALPISPRVLFTVFSDSETRENLTNASSQKLVVTFNRSQVYQADTYVFATDDAQSRLVERYLRRPVV
ncbi:MAG: DUF4238 domain-containing protein [Ramlibacter sp.]|nr:DUF4238 domain-containing protein [Ramlibacter sp.]